MSAGTVPLVWSMPAAERRAFVAQAIGRRAEVHYSALRASDNLDEVVGIVLAVASPLTGAPVGTAQLVLELDAGDVVTISLATIARIKVARW